MQQRIYHVAVEVLAKSILTDMFDSCIDAYDARKTREDSIEAERRRRMEAGFQQVCVSSLLLFVRVALCFCNLVSVVYVGFSVYVSLYFFSCVFVSLLHCRLVKHVELHQVSVYVDNKYIFKAMCYANNANLSQQMCSRACGVGMHSQGLAIFDLQNKKKRKMKENRKSKQKGTARMPT